MEFTIRTLVQTIHRFASQKDIPLLCLRPYEFKSTLHDIDLFTPPYAVSHIIQYLESISIIVYQKSITTQFSSFHIYYRHNGTLIHVKLDFIHSFSLYGIEYLNPKSITENKILINDIYYMDIFHQTLYLITLYHIKHRKPLSKQYYQFVLQGLSQNKDAIHLFFIQHFGKKWGTDIVLNIKDNQQQKNKNYVFFYIYNSWHNYGFMTLIYFLRYISQKILYILKPKTQFIIILGVDGSGKTTLINKIKSERFFLNAVYAHFLPAWPVWGSEYDSSHIQNNPHDNPPRTLIISIIKLFLYVFRYWVVFLWPIKQPRIYIFDRYIYDILVDQKRFRYQGPTKVLEIMYAIVPKPKAIICIDIDPKTAFDRKNELPAYEVTRQTIQYRKTLEKLDNVVFLKGENTIQDNVHLAISYIIQNI